MGLVQEKKRQGLIRHVGFSFHSTPEELEQILSAHPEMEFVQLQINYGDWENPAVQSRACYEVARRHEKPVIIMEPVKGGMLATPPEPVVKIFRKANPQASNASWAIRFAASLEGVITVLSGMSNLEQMEDNLSYMRNFAPPVRGRTYHNTGSAEGVEQYSAHSLHHLQLLRKSLSQRHRDLGIVHRDELPDVV